jgi:hypothetical protein
MSKEVQGHASARDRADDPSPQREREPRRPGTDDLSMQTALAGPAASLDAPTLTPYQFRRGFLESVTCTAADWLAHGDAIYAREPVTEVTLTTWPTLYTYRNRARSATRSRWT